jgi:type I restriction enzyme R subunit
VEEGTRRPARRSGADLPRYHQLDVVRKRCSPMCRKHGAGKRYLIQHSAGSGKSNSIAWLAHQLIGLRAGRGAVFDSIIVITDRRILDQQIRDTIKGFAQVAAIIGARRALEDRDLRKFLKTARRSSSPRCRSFPSCSTRSATSIAAAVRHHHRRSALQPGRQDHGGDEHGLVAESGAEQEDESPPRTRSTASSSRARCCPTPATSPSPPRRRTRRWRCSASPIRKAAKVKHRPFHSYTMKQAIQEGFILDVLKHYTPVESYYKLAKTVEDDPEFDTKKAQKKLRLYVESHDKAIRDKAEIMVDHFHEQVIGPNKIGGRRGRWWCHRQHRAAIQYFFAFAPTSPNQEPLSRPSSPSRASRSTRAEKVSEAKLNGFPSNDIADKIQEDPYRFLICADKFQTGYDEPLLHTMYVDKALAGIKAVQTLSRLNRAHPQKRDVFVLDFMNDTETIEKWPSPTTTAPRC